MNQLESKKIAEKLSLNDLKTMFVKASEEIKDWTVRSKINLGLSIGATFNILSSGFSKYKSENEIPIHVRRYMIQEFGQFLPPHFLDLIKKEKIQLSPPSHQEPNFDNLKDF